MEPTLGTTDPSIKKEKQEKVAPMLPYKEFDDGERQEKTQSTELILCMTEKRRVLKLFVVTTANVSAYPLFTPHSTDGKG